MPKVTGAVTTSAASLVKLITAAGAVLTAVWVTIPQTVSDNLTIPANVVLRVDAPGKITVATGKTLTINGPAEIGLYQAFYGDGAVVLTKTREVFPEWFGAARDGVTDDTDAIAKAEAAAYASSATLIFSAGTYLYTDYLEPRVNIWAYGATIKQKSATETGTNTVGLLWYNGKSDLEVRGGTWDGNFKSSGIGGQGVCLNLKFFDVTTQNCIRGGFTFYNCSRIRHYRCRALDIRYQADFAGPADGFMFGGCNDSSTEDCYAFRLRRIGFVSEDDAGGGHKSDRIIFNRCMTEETHHCNDSATEFNAGFWMENTNSGAMIDCVAYNVSSGVGQASGRVRGFEVSSGQSGYGVIAVTRPKVIGNAVRMPTAFAFAGTGTFCTIVAEDAQCEKVVNGFSCLGGLNELQIIRPRINDMVHSAANNGGIILDGTGPTALNKLVIDDYRETAVTYSGGSCGILIYAATSDTEYTLQNCNPGVATRHGMAAALSLVRVKGSSLNLGSPLYASFLAGDLYLDSDSHFGVNASNAVNSPIISLAACPNGSRVHITGGRYTGIVSQFGGVDCSVYVDGILADSGTQFQITTTGTFRNKFTGCTFLGGPADGCIKTNFNAPGTKQTLIVESCHFEASNVANTPIQKWNNDPTVVVLQGNTYNTTNLHSFTATTSVVNNVAV